MCGIAGFISTRENVIDYLIYALHSMRHRGHDSAGLVTYDSDFSSQVELGTVDEVISRTNLEKLSGSTGIAHVRYATMGRVELKDSQPIVINDPFKIAMAHNGNVANFNDLSGIREKTGIKTENDVAYILGVMIDELEKFNAITHESVIEAIKGVQKRVSGGYSVVGMIDGIGIFAFKDPHGIRPLVLGKKITNAGSTYGFASESSVFDYIGFDTVKELSPGEIVFIDRKMNIHSTIGHQKKHAFCCFEFIYFAREDSVIHNKQVADIRIKMGRKLGFRLKKLGFKPDFVTEVPRSGYFFAAGVAEGLEVPYRRVFTGNKGTGRSFIIPSKKKRIEILKQKIKPIERLIEGKKIAVVDDSIVRGTTSKQIIKLLHENDAKEIYFISASPPVKYPCFYGIDMSMRDEIIAAQHTPEDIAKIIGADAVIFQSIEDLRKTFTDFSICDACFSGEYPTPITEEIENAFKKDKIDSGRL